LWKSTLDFPKARDHLQLPFSSNITIKGDLQQAGADLRASLVDGNPVWLGELAEDCE
jgi:hypothetical protein